jgi:hypothetical protein
MHRLRLTFLRLVLLVACLSGTAPVHAQDAAQALAQAAAPAPAPGVQAPPPEEDQPARTLPQTQAEAEGLYVEFGRGVNLAGDDGNFRLTLRGRLQVRSTYERRAEDGEENIFFQARRARLVFLGQMREQNLQLYLQLGMGASDLERDASVPLRDAVITWTPLRATGLRMGQMKVPFSRERIISSSALQLADRSPVNAEFNLDRDVGLQAFSNDLFGWGVLSGQVGVYGGDGRNRAAQGTGLLYAGRLQVQPLGEFADSLVEADLTRERRVRLSLGVAAGLNLDARREQSTIGAFYTDQRWDMRHASADVLIKYAGFSLQSEAIVRDATLREGSATAEDGTLRPARVGWGWMAQGGWVSRGGYELSGRWARIEAAADTPSAIADLTEVTLGAGYYVRNHDLKIQADVGRTWVEGAQEVGMTGRVQVQVFF